MGFKTEQKLKKKKKELELQGLPGKEVASEVLALASIECLQSISSLLSQALYTSESISVSLEFWDKRLLID